MRRFTKEHNELDWLFPLADNLESASKLFNEIEDEAKYKLEICYDDQTEFTADDMIDSFMKGYSICMQKMMSIIAMEKADANFWKREAEFHQQMTDKLLESINKKSNNQIEDSVVE